MLAETAVPNSSSQYRFLRPISRVLHGLLQGLDQDQSLYRSICIAVRCGL